jgi:ribonuclease Z
MCYICHTPSIPGKFDAKKALALGLTKGPKFGQLTKGIPGIGGEFAAQRLSVTTDDGRVINPSDCIGPVRRGAVFIVVDCPTLSHAKALTSKPQFDQYKQSGMKTAVLL